MHSWRMQFQKGGPPNVDRAVREAPLEIVVELLFLTKLANSGSRRLKGPSRLVHRELYLWLDDERNCEDMLSPPSPSTIP